MKAWVLMSTRVLRLSERYEYVLEIASRCIAGACAAYGTGSMS